MLFIVATLLFAYYAVLPNLPTKPANLAQEFASEHLYAALL